MPVAYHLIYYAILVLLVVAVRLVHLVFLIPLVLYCSFLLKRKLIFVIAVVLCLTPLFIRPYQAYQFSSIIHGRVVDMNDASLILKTKQGKIKVLTKQKFHYQDELILKVTPVEINRKKDDGDFDEEMYLKSHHIITKMKMVKVIERRPHFSLANVFVQHFSNNKQIRSYQNMFLLGMKDEAIKSDYQVMTSLSIVHLFALSGMHITILYNILFKIFSLFLKKHHADYLSKGIMGFYVFSIPFNISLQRAYLMLIGKSLFHKRLNDLDLLSILIIAHVLYNPYVIYNISFVFSYFIYFMVILTKHIKGQSIIVYLSSLPIVLCMNASLNIFSFFLSSVLEPFIIVFYTLFVFSLFLPLEYLLNLLIGLFVSMLDFTQALSSFIVLSKPTLFFIGLFYYCIFACIIQKERQRSIRKPVCLLVALMISFTIFSRYKIYTDVTMIDVGQGDCTLVRLPFNQGNYLIDTGGNVKYDLATNKIIPYLKSVGISRIDAVFISHYDYDHSGALDSLKSHFDVRKVIDKPFKKMQKGNVTIESLTTDHVFSDINDNSNIIYLTIDDVKYLFTGDLGVEGEEALMNKYGSLDVDILKVGHHGSKTSSSVEFITMLKPKVAMIGVGKKNRYGHPSQIVIKRMKNMGSTILRTDQDGSFTIRHMFKEYYILNEKS